MELRPLFNKIVIIREADETLSEGGIVIPDKHAEKPLRGEVVAVGPGKYLDNGDLIEIQVSIGDKVVFGKHAGEEVELEGDKYTVMTDDEVLAVVLDDE